MTTQHASDVPEIGNWSRLLDDKVAVEISTFSKNTFSVASDLYTVQFVEAQIVYTRTDGFNEPGVDVPFPLVQGLSLAVLPDSSGTTSWPT